MQILFATRLLGLSEHQVGLSYVALGVGTIAASPVGQRVARRSGPGRAGTRHRALRLGLVAARAGPGRAAAACCLRRDAGQLRRRRGLSLHQLLALRQAVTPAPLLGA